ncbi:MAG: nucleoside triphosphate pyrophosphohydrolase [Proteobacteria bacterium]|nr:nucleoside triphosphate pyrophosphohydrolase [Pseudomonadota bacterium]
MTTKRDICGLIDIVAALRTPHSGCPWDLEQTFASVAPYTIEEAYEVADAIARGDIGDLREELGDLLFQVVLHARIAEDDGQFAFGDVVAGISEKMVRRHPHVFGTLTGVSREDLRGLWAEIKAQEKAERAARGDMPAPGRQGALAGVAVDLPALTRARKLQENAGTVGFDWNDARSVLAKIREETEEIAEAVKGGDQAAIAGEVGDLLFAVVNLARHLGVDPEGALRGTSVKFERRFAHIEAALADVGRKPADATLAEMEALWDAAKRAERAPAPGKREREK